MIIFEACIHGHGRSTFLSTCQHHGDPPGKAHCSTATKTDQNAPSRSGKNAVPRPDVDGWPAELYPRRLRDARLRHCSFDLDTMTFEARLGGGLDGCVWKVRFGDQGPFALKVVSTTKSVGLVVYTCLHGTRLVSASFGILSRQRLPITTPRSESAKMPPCSR